MSIYKKYPNQFEIYKRTTTGDPNTGGGVVVDEKIIEGYCSLQRGSLIRGDKEATFDYLICFDINNSESIPNPPDTLLIDNACTVKVLDQFGNTLEDNVTEQTHNEMGSTVFFNIVNENG